jgi:predicted metalloprotease
MVPSFLRRQPAWRLWTGVAVTLVLVLGLAAWGLNRGELVERVQEAVVLAFRPFMGPGRPPAADQKPAGPRDDFAKFIGKVAGEAEDRWKEIFDRAGLTYRAPKIVIYSRKTPTACGKAKRAIGPFYCPDDERVYLDADFFKEVQEITKGCEPGSKRCEFPLAVIVAHEIGHHIQKLTGTMEKSMAFERTLRGAAANRVQAQAELQADCYAGIWANHAERKHKFLEPGDLDAAVKTTSQAGDDVQAKAQGETVAPENFTHGSGEQRLRWFKRGFDSGDMAQCDTFAAAEL